MTSIVACAERRDLSNRTRNHVALHQKFPWKSYSTTHLPFLLSNFKILNLSQKLFTRKWRLLNAQEEKKKVLKPLPEVPEAKTSSFVYLWLAVDMSFQTYWQGKQTNKNFTLIRRNNQVINLPSTEKGHIVYSRQINKDISMSNKNNYERAIPEKIEPDF